MAETQLRGSSSNLSVTAIQQIEIGYAARPDRFRDEDNGEENWRLKESLERWAVTYEVSSVLKLAMIHQSHSGRETSEHRSQVRLFHILVNAVSTLSHVILDGCRVGWAVFQVVVKA